MATITVSIETSAAQDESLAWLLTCVNADAVHVEKPLPDVSALLTEIVQTAIEDCVPRCQQRRKAYITDALDRATPDEWAQIAKLLKIELPGGDAVAAVAAVVP
jgi:hypothetical protein